MLKLNASYSKKVPAEQEFSSKSYHVSLELELPAGLTADQLQEKIHETFELARESVESEIHGDDPKRNVQVINTTPSHTTARQFPAKNSGGQNNGNRNADQPASNKQIGFLTDLLKKGSYDIAATCANYGVASLYDLSRKQCSEIIDGLQQAKSA